ncbi:hypothetical protein PVAP13_9NG457100 [Panicum virgatum]|uniref:Secreted protein n=1 Tax=Panicum virgatum TaxID=38727 RepID=A0A8T0MPP2_PANVG|nr:hypothetical protein PVAP13_9NG457100 [Panicum virgatum]
MDEHKTRAHAIFAQYSLLSICILLLSEQECIYSNRLPLSPHASHAQSVLGESNVHVLTFSMKKGEGSGRSSRHSCKLKL